MARPIPALTLVAALVTLFPAAALADGEGQTSEATSAAPDGSSATSPTARAGSEDARAEARGALPKAPARAATRPPTPTPEPASLLPDVDTGEQYKSVIEAVEERVKNHTADASDLRRLAAMKADYAEREHMRSPVLAVAGAFLLVTGATASILGLGLAIGGAGASGSGGSIGGAGLVPIGLAGFAGGIGIAVGGNAIYAYGAFSELDPATPPRTSRVMVRFSPFGAAGTF
ncbi:MAG: hypothetical protein IPK71_05875 [Myxococcales bacterium]|nr:hypothetical protein [Myxococcales bacterium]